MEIKVSEGESLTIQDKALLEMGKKMIEDSLSVGRDFSKHMMTISSSSILGYIAIIGLFFKQDSINIYFILPVILLIAALLMFGISLYPNNKKISLELIDEVSTLIHKTIRHRRIYYFIGFSLYALSIFFIMILMIFKR